MKSVLKIAALVLALIALVGLSDSPAEAQRGRSSIKRVHGHSIVSRSRMKSLKSGKHHVHTARSGHRVHAQLQGSKVHSLHVTDKKGRSVAVHKKFVRKGGRRRASLSPLDNDLIAQELARSDLAGEEFTPTQVGLSVQVFVVFSFQINGQTVMIFFPASSVFGGNNISNPNSLPTDPNIPTDPNGGDDGSGDDTGF